MSSEDPLPRPGPPRPPYTLVTPEVFIGGGGNRADRGGDPRPRCIGSSVDVEESDEDIGCAVMDPSAVCLATAAANPT